MEMMIDKLTYGPDAIGRIDGVAVFVPGVIPGDKVDVKITKKMKNYWRAEVERVIKKSDRYVKAPCPVFEKCGGCHWQNLSYADQLDCKMNIVSETIAHLGGVRDFKVSPVIGCSNPFGYRNKIQQPLGIRNGKVISGFYERGSHRIVPVERCILEMEPGNKIIKYAREVIGKLKLSIYDEKTHRGILRHLIVRISKLEKTSILTVAATGRFPEEKQFAGILMKEIPSLKGVLVNINSRRDNVILGREFHCVEGEGFIREKIGHVKFIVSAGTFFQTNTTQAEEMCRVVESMAGLKGSEVLLDLYSGVGMIGMFLAGKAEKVFLVEENPAAVSDAIKNAGLNKLENLQLFEGRVEDVLQKSGALKNADVIVLDPPRQGAGEKVIGWIEKSQAKKVIYVSCDLGTFCRDLKSLAGAGFKLETLVPIDMFPQTYHVEIAAKFTR